VLVRRGRTYFAAGGKGKILSIYTHNHTQVANRGKFGKNHFDFAKKQRFLFVEFRECTSLGKRRGKTKDFHLLNFENAHPWVIDEDENLYKISL